MNAIIELRHELHRYPELSCREKETMERLKAFLRKNTNLEIVEKENWFYAVYHGNTPETECLPPIAFRADMDALPMEDDDAIPYHSCNNGVAHKCGHDGHSAALAGFGCMLEELHPNRDVYLIFQYGEEIGAGGDECSNLLIEKNISEVYACHNWSGFPKGKILVKTDTTHMASQGLTITFEGKSAHASQPEDGVNPSAAIAEMALYIEKDLRTWCSERTSFAMVTIVGMGAGGKNYGIAASEGYLAVTLRTEREQELSQLRTRLLEKAEELGHKYGLKVSYEEADYFPATMNDNHAVEKVLRAAENIGTENGMLEQAIRSSEDFGYYLQKASGAMFYVGNGEDYAEIHTREYDFPDDNLAVIIHMFAALCNES